MNRITPIIIAVLVLALSVILEFRAKKDPNIKKLDNLLRSGSFLSPTILSLVTGFILIWSGYSNYLLIPDFVLGNSLFDTIARFAQVIIGIGLVLGIFLRLSTLLIIALLGTAFINFPALQVLEQSVFIGIAAFLFFMPQDSLSFSFYFHKVFESKTLNHLRKFAYPLLQIITGLSLIYIGLYDKILSPETEIIFLEQHSFVNFVQSLFGLLSFSHEDFVFATGVFIIIGGLNLVFGLLPRLTAAVIGLMLLFAMVISGIETLVIYLPYFAVLYVIITGNQFAPHVKEVRA